MAGGTRHLNLFWKMIFLTPDAEVILASACCKLSSTIFAAAQNFPAGLILIFIAILPEMS